MQEEQEARQEEQEARQEEQEAGGRLSVMRLMAVMGDRHSAGKIPLDPELYDREKYRFMVGNDGSIWVKKNCGKDAGVAK